MTYDLHAFVQRERAREARAQEESRALWAEARQEAEALARRMAASCGDGLKTVMLFGSVARGEPRAGARPDIDLALEASPDAFLRAVSVALGSPFDVDVIDLRHIPAGLRQAIERDGVVLHER